MVTPPALGVTNSHGVTGLPWLPMFEHNICTESAISFLARAKESKGNLEDLPQNVLVIGGLVINHQL